MKPSFYHWNSKARLDIRKAVSYMLISEVWGEFVQYKLLEEGRSEDTILKYHDCIKRFIGLEGDLEITEIRKEHLLDMRMKLKKLSVARVSSIIFCVRSLLRYCREEKEMSVIDPSLIKLPRRTRKEIIYLTNDEVKDFLAEIDITDIHGLRMRTLCELLLDTGARISEALQLDRTSIRREDGITFARVIGKGNKERKLFISGRPMFWIEKYLETRTDSHPALFVTHCEAKRLKKNGGTKDFKKIAKRAGIYKQVSPHIFRHTFCTNLLKNGAGMAQIQRLAGHEDISTTMKFYARLDDIDLVAAKWKLSYE